MADLHSSTPTSVSEPLPGDHASAIAPLLRSRRHQMFPVLNEKEIQRIFRFGTAHSFADGARIVEAGHTMYGMVLALSGRMAVHRSDGLGNSAFITHLGPGEFTAEVSQLAGGPSLVNVSAAGEVEALVISPANLRALVIAEAELGERIVRALILRRLNLLELGAGVLLVGPAGHPCMFPLQSFLTINAYPHKILDPGNDAQARALCDHYQPARGDFPLVVCPDGGVRKNPSNIELSRALGMLPELPADRVWDVIVVGAGPAGLAASVYAGSEGLSVLVLDQLAYGGQAAASARIENYLGFPTGISGGALAGRAYVQAMKFGVEVVIPAAAARLICDTAPLEVALSDSRRVRAHSVVLACGARYRRPSLANLKQFEGRGVYYWASHIEASLCMGEEVILVGGGNSAGQGAVFLSEHASRVHMVVRGEGLKATMSRYLVDRIMAAPNIELHTHTEIVALEGDEEGLRQVRLRNKRSGAEEDRDVRRVFLFIGADPNTDWLDDCEVEVDDKGFILTGNAVTTPASHSCAGGGPALSSGAPRPRAALETSVPGVFAIGDVRAGSTKRVAASVGEGAQVVPQLHGFLAKLPVSA
ncbi:FAD-dependent oxidoreductase [Massilia niastensis]|uniref:FAD-dependent oxidoreductase n=1 Tax=Massilia niastensis TaxID=544911 RepID=UPI0012EB6A2A|nr:cyclic nucleotide-binding domain-containing thioredoxin-disulfide reductase [Massilia niastensis]